LSGLHIVGVRSDGKVADISEPQLMPNEPKYNKLYFRSVYSVSMGEKQIQKSSLNEYWKKNSQ